MSGVASLGAGGRDCRPGCCSVRLSHVGGLGGLVGRRLGLLEVGDGALELGRDVGDALLGLGHHVLLHGHGVGGFDGGLVGVLGSRLGRGDGGVDGVELVLSLLGGFLGGVGRILGLLVEGQFALELLLSFAQFPLDVTDERLSSY